jgi:hypothetical protein
MAYGRLRDACGRMPPAPARHCPRCFRVYMDAARERAMVHECRVCLERQAEMFAGRVSA